MPEYRRTWVTGGTFFITIATYHRRPLFTDERIVDLWRGTLQQAMIEKPFTIHAGVVLPDHVHLIVALPRSDDDLSSRIGRAKALFTRAFRAGRASREDRAVSPPSRSRHRESSSWQRRFWDHLIRDEDEFEAYMDYVHFNPVKHGLVDRPIDWPWSSFKHWVSRGVYEPGWGTSLPPDRFKCIEGLCGE